MSGQVTHSARCGGLPSYIRGSIFSQLAFPPDGMWLKSSAREGSRFGAIRTGSGFSKLRFGWWVQLATPVAHSKPILSPSGGHDGEAESVRR